MSKPYAITYAPAGAELPAVVIPTAKCMQCGRLFAQAELRRITCSDHCRREYLADAPKPVRTVAEPQGEPNGSGPVDCVMCGNPFHRYGMDVRSTTCSTECRLAHRRLISERSLRRIAQRDREDKRSHQTATNEGTET